MRPGAFLVQAHSTVSQGPLSKRPQNAEPWRSSPRNDLTRFGVDPVGRLARIRYQGGHLYTSTSESYHRIWRKYLRDRVGQFRLRELRTVDVNRMLAAIAKEKVLAKGTFKRIKSVLSAIFIYAKNVGAFDGANPVLDAFIPRNAREAGETHAYDLSQVVQILAALPLLAKGLVATAAFAGLRFGELRGLEWTNYTGDQLKVSRSVWRSVVSPPKTQSSCDSVPVVRQLAQILDQHRKFMGDPQAGVIFHSGDGSPINLGAFTRRVIRPALEAIGVPYGWHAFRRGLASNLYALGLRPHEKIL